MTMRHKVLLVPFPFDDFSHTKVRPALCLTEPMSRNGHLVLAFISSNVNVEPLPFDIILNADDPAFAPTGLKVSSVIRLHRLTTMSVSIVKYELGHIVDPTVQEVQNRLKRLFIL